MNYFIKVVSDVVVGVFQEFGFPPSMVGAYSDGKRWVANLNKVDPIYYPMFDVYPCTLSGTGNLPDVGDITWNSGTKTGSGALVPVVPFVSRNITPREFKARFTNAEKVAIYGSTDPLVRSYLDDLVMAPYVDLDLQDNRDGLDYLVAIGLLVEGRQDVILA